MNAIKWASNYFIKCHVSPNELYGQVGDFVLDHAFWGRPEDLNMSRPAYKIDKDHPGRVHVEIDKLKKKKKFPEVKNSNNKNFRKLVYSRSLFSGSDLAGETAAALAAVSLAFKNVDPDYSALCLKHAKELYSFAINYRGFYHEAIKGASQYYE